jgi:hypothetical protein
VILVGSIVLFRTPADGIRYIPAVNQGSGHYAEVEGAQGAS